METGKGGAPIRQDPFQAAGGEVLGDFLLDGEGNPDIGQRRL